MGTEYSGDNKRLHEEISEIKFTPISDSMHQLYKWYESNMYLVNEKELLFDK
jgi:hypothetical protein